MIYKSIKEQEEFLAGDETRLREVLHPKNDGIALPYSLAFARLEEGEVSLAHRLRKSSELYIFQKGQGCIFIEGREQVVQPGDVVLVPAGALQHVENKGKGSMEFYCVVSPPWREDEEDIETS